jgi:hypothetical protein
MKANDRRDESFGWHADSRFALYYAPAAASPWWSAGCRWLSRDPESGAALTPPVVHALAERSTDVPTLARAPRRYGWHGTLVAPARGAEGIAFDAIVDHARRWARQQRPFDLAVDVAALERFVAIRPATDEGAAAMRALAGSALHAFAHLRARPSETEQRRRLETNLTARQRELLDQWGYPYVLDEFRFHMTLSDSIEAPERQAMIDWWRQRLPELGSLPIHGAALYVEPRPGEPFVLAERLPFGDAP